MLLKVFFLTTMVKWIYGKIPRQYLIIAALIFRLVSSLWCFPLIGFIVPCFDNDILNFVAADTCLFLLRAIYLNYIELLINRQ